LGLLVKSLKWKYSLQTLTVLAI